MVIVNFDTVIHAGRSLNGGAEVYLKAMIANYFQNVKYKSVLLEILGCTVVHKVMKKILLFFTDQ